MKTDLRHLPYIGTTPTATFAPYPLLRDFLAEAPVNDLLVQNHRPDLIPTVEQDRALSLLDLT